MQNHNGNGYPSGFGPPGQAPGFGGQAPGYGPPGPQAQPGYGPPGGQAGYGPPGPQAQPGYGPPGASPHQAALVPAGFGAPLASAGAPTVLGVPLEPGERVVWFKEHSHATEKWMMIILGVLLLIVLVGLVFIWLGMTTEKRNPRAHAVTNRRLIFWPGQGEPQFFAISQLADIEPERQRAHGGGGLLGAAIGAAVTAALDHSANKKEKTSAAYWKRTIAMKVQTVQGQQLHIPLGPGYGAQVGELVARVRYNGEGESLPVVPFKA